ncbi:hypothetical protein [Paenibacillus sp. PL2-23]|uniref:hypothetical protein n=1 Tax=Paenibacillus sp. PL2-23 TaxID=2100729 RepID=UPI0030F6EB0A
MALHIKLCETDNELAMAGVFFLKNRRDLHPSFMTMNVVELLYTYATQGKIVIVLDEAGLIVGLSAFYIGTPEENFQNQDTALIDLAIGDRSYRGSRMFVKGLQFVVQSIVEQNPQVKELRLVAYSSNAYLCRLYAKFMNKGGQREGQLGQETVFFTSIAQIKTILGKYSVV